MFSLIYSLTLILSIPNIHSGDFIFLDLDCGEICDSIEQVTSQQFGVASPRLSHIGILSFEAKQNRWFVLEAWPKKGVVMTRLEEFTSRVSAGENEVNGFYLGRMKRSFRGEALEALENAKKYLGRPYDENFLWKNDRYYCSELVVQFWPSKYFFGALRPMFFGANDSVEFRVWQQYYESLDMPVPTGELGVSPLGIYLLGMGKVFD